MALHKKAIEMQIFTFIFALILIALLMAYGMKTLTGFNDTTEQVELADFFLKLQDYTTMLYSFDIGSSQDITLSLPSTVQQVCFYDSSRSITEHIDQTLSDHLAATPDHNIFLIPSTLTPSSFSANNLRVLHGPNPLCMPAKQKIAIRLQTSLDESNQIVVDVRQPQPPTPSP